MNFLRIFSTEKTHNRALPPHVVLIAGVLLLLLSVIASLCFGAASVTPSALFADLAGKGDGAGKSTELNMISGFITRDGEMLISKVRILPSSGAVNYLKSLQLSCKQII